MALNSWLSTLNSRPRPLEAPVDIERTLEANAQATEVLLAPEEHDPLDVIVRKMGRIAVPFDRRPSWQYFLRLTTDRPGLASLIARAGG
jgi:hypothetical protein